MLLLIVGSVAAWDRQPVISVDLRDRGVPRSSFLERARCIPYQSYHAVRWIDAEKVLIAFSTGSTCAGQEPNIANNLRLVTFDAHGHFLHSTDLPYESSLESNTRLRHGGIWVGPGNKVIVEIPWIPGTKFGGRVRVLDQDLTLIQEIETESDATEEKYRSFTHYGVRFEGVSADRKSILFSRDNGNGHQRTCVVYGGTRLEPLSECPLEEVNAINKESGNPGGYPVPKGYEIAYSSPGRSDDGARASVFLTKEENGYCQLAGVFCPLWGTLIVFDTQPQHSISVRTVFRKRFRTAHLALAPDGKHIAAFDNRRLTIFPLP